MEWTQPLKAHLLCSGHLRIPQTGQWAGVAGGTACPRAFYLCAGQRVLVHKSLDKLLRPDVPQPFLHQKGEEELGKGAGAGRGGAHPGPGMVLLRAPYLSAHPGRSLDTCPAH